MQATPQTLIDWLRRSALRSLAAAAALAMLAPASAAADSYVVFGQVRQVDPDDAENVEIETADLRLGDPIPFSRVGIYERTSGDTVAETWSDANGQYSVSFSAGSSVDVEVRAFLAGDGGLAPLPAARPGINNLTLASLGPVTSLGASVKVASELITEAGSASSTLPYPGVGIVFTEVGKVEIPYIEQALDHPLVGEIGLANMTTAEARARAHELGLPESAAVAASDGAFDKAPFGDRLLIFGGFGLPGGGASCSGSIDWYQVTIEELAETAPDTTPPLSSFVWNDPLSKKRYAVQTFPTIDVTTTDARIGPYPGRLGTASGTLEPGLYQVNEEPPSTTRQVFYSFPNLRVNWVSSNYNGLYRLKMRYFRHLSWAVVNEVPVVEEIPASCFIGSLPSSVAGSAAVGELVLRVDNHALDVHFDSLVATGSSTNFVEEENLCEQIHLGPGAANHVTVGFTARHLGGYLRYYAMGASSNDHVAVGFGAADDFRSQPTTPAPPWPLWSGTPASGISRSNAVPFPKDCVYTFDLVAASRIQNGYGYVQSAHQRTSFYIDVTP